MDINTLLSTVVLVSFIVTVVLAVGSYLAFKGREYRRPDRIGLLVRIQGKPDRRGVRGADPTHDPGHVQPSSRSSSAPAAAAPHRYNCLLIGIPCSRQ